jgi:hypothetical protein
MLPVILPLLERLLCFSENFFLYGYPSIPFMENALFVRWGVV